MRDKKGNGLYTYNLNPEFLNFLAKFQEESQQISFILEDAGCGNVEDYLDEAEQEEKQGKVKKLFQDIFKKAG